jgi:subtilisin family serine protease
MRSFLIILLLFAGVYAPIPDEILERLAGRLGRAKLLDENAPNRVADQYIIVFKSDVEDSAQDEVENNLKDPAPGLLRAQEVRGRFKIGNMKGITARLGPRAVTALLENDRIAWIEPDKQVTIAATQTGAPWGLDRIDQASLPLSGTFTYPGAGSGVDAYVIDTGIRTGHNEFQGRASAGTNFVKTEGANDCAGHGTFIAGLIGGKTYGVAKSANLISVKAFDCNGNGYLSDVVLALAWVQNRAATSGRRSVINLSFGAITSSTSVDVAVTNVINSGVPVVVAAGNLNYNSCAFSPARVPEAIVVGASTKTDSRASWSNHGTCIDLFAPGEDVVSASQSSNTATRTDSGTSFSTAYVAGIAAVKLAQNPSSTPAQIQDSIKNAASQNKLSNVPAGTPKIISLIS